MELKKKTFFKIHSWIGINLGILFFIVCFSGTMATLSREMDWLANPAARASPQNELASRNAVMVNFRQAYPEAEITRWIRPEEPYLCDILYKTEGGIESYIFANPYTGKIQGEAGITFQRFFRDFHYFLFIPFEIGHFTVLFFAFLLLVSVITALFFYKNWWRKMFKLQTGKGVLVLFRSLHRLVGVWSVPFTLIFSVTGIWYFMERANVAGINDTADPDPQEVVDVQYEGSDLPKTSDLDYDRAIGIAERAVPQLKVGTLYVGEETGGSIYLTGHSDVPLVRQRANRVYIDPTTYGVLETRKATKIGTVTYLNDIADPIHFGNWGGLTTKIIWFVLGLAISSLIATGIWIAVKRKVQKRKKTKKKVMGVWGYINCAVYLIMMGCMYYSLIDEYRASTTAIFLISLGWTFFLLLAYYIFVVRMKVAVHRIASSKP
ncbi:PepSY-associated TM helix domain-containing protein [Pricia sp. S334]|uniref:PepSY-associated TM helix domain-containing protein n=1 Tax=Pricia mediterranea TaxID=3076079 RepID=A0ABU3L953_9FLAO|nr:PepSY-associated TM helix domain-containing protein [Pricia sp. S334]MDT7829763.1 PepSY-associated TM helix domain-containing protein [Pricia sp. S334]